MQHNKPGCIYVLIFENLFHYAAFVVQPAKVR